MIEHVISAAQLVTPLELEEGKVTYQRYQEILRGVADKYQYPLTPVIEAFAMLSPNCNIFSNLRSVVSLLEAHSNNLPEEHATVVTYNHNRAKAWRILNGEKLLEVTQGPKVLAFATNILHPSNRSVVTIDGHMVAMSQGIRSSLRAARKFDYDSIAEEIRVAAARFGIKIASQMQAALWLSWRNRHSIKPVLPSLIHPEWKKLYGVEQIKPFPTKGIQQGELWS